MEADKPERADGAPPDAAPPLDGLRVLLCESETLIVLMLRRALASARMAVAAEAGTATDAVRLANLHQPDIALVAEVLGRDDGWEAAREILACCACCLIMLTASPETEVAQRRREVGVHGCIAKPVLASELIGQVGASYAEHLRRLPPPGPSAGPIA